MLTEREALTLSIYLWQKIVDDYQIHMYYDREKYLHKKSIYFRDIHISAVKAILVEELEYLYGEELIDEWFQPASCSLCAYAEQRISRYDSDYCYLCPLFERWGDSTRCYRPGSPYYFLDNCLAYNSRQDILYPNLRFLAFVQQVLDLMIKARGEL